jgi:hypothetical protein
LLSGSPGHKGKRPSVEARISEGTAPLVGLRALQDPSPRQKCSLDSGCWRGYLPAPLPPQRPEDACHWGHDTAGNPSSGRSPANTGSLPGASCPGGIFGSHCGKTCTC